MSKQVTRLVRRRHLRQAWGAAALGVLGGLAGCHPEVDGVSGQCRVDADCGEGGRCRAGRCQPLAVAPVRAAAVPTTTPEGRAPRASNEGLGPIEAPREHWAVDLGAVIYARPTLVVSPEGQVIAYVGTHAGRFVGVVAEGPEQGRVVLDLWVDGIIWSTAVADPRGWLYFGADDDHLRAVDPRAGGVAWSLRLGSCEPPRTPGPEGVRCDVDGGPSLGPDGDLYVGADGLYRVSPAGQVRWHYPPRDEGPAAHVVTTPLVTEAQVVFGSYGRRVVAVDHGGALRWSLELGADVDGSPAQGRDGTIYVGADQGGLHAITPEGELRWRSTIRAPVRAAPVVGADGVVVVGSYDGSLYAVEPDGGVRWQLPTGSPIHAAATLDPAGRLFVGGRDEHLYALDLDGRVFWRVEMPGQIDAPVAIAPGGTLVVGGDDGVLRGLR